MEPSQIDAVIVEGFLTATSAHSGNMIAPVMEREVIVEETTSSGGGLLIPLFALLLFAAAASSSGSSGPPVQASDARFKTDILQTGMTGSGLPLYQFRYIGGTTLFEGVMAQDVLQHTPDAVLTGPGGMLLVDYSKIDAIMRVID